jgi:N-acetylglucosamine kinase-like BadF-type ATPase
MMYLIADGGATKTDWALVDNGKLISRIYTLGMNPFQASEEIIENIVRDELVTQLPAQAISPSIFFYGAGCTPEKCIVIKGILSKFFPESNIFVSYDLLGSARGLCGHQPGIACILGTGSNSCYYDGENIAENTPSLGYVLGDEGSGAVIGKTLVADILKGIMPEHITKKFYEETQLTKADILDKVYRQPMPSRFLASMTPFVSRHKEEEPFLRDLAVRNFRLFFSRCIVPYKRPHLKVNFVGGLAFSFETELKEAAAAEGFEVGKIAKGPMEGLILYHSES